jgi:hypothetical protein
MAQEPTSPKTSTTRQLASGLEATIAMPAVTADGQGETQGLTNGNTPANGSKATNGNTATPPAAAAVPPTPASAARSPGAVVPGAKTAAMTRGGQPDAKAVPTARALPAGSGARETTQRGTTQRGAAAPLPALMIDEEDEGGFMAAMHTMVRTTPSWLTSMVVHVVALLVLGLITVPRISDDQFNDLVVDSVDPGEQIEELDAEDMEELKFEEASLVDAATTDATEAIEIVEDPIPTLSAEVQLSEMGEIQALSENLLTSAGSSATGDLGLRASDAGRMAAVASGGGSAGSEEAVGLALAWLAKHQNPDGSWSFDHRTGACQGRCDHTGSLKQARFGATGMGLLPFLGAGHTHKQGKYKDNVKAALMFLCQNMNQGSMYEAGGSLYSHGIGTIAVCEAYAMTQDKGLFAPAQQAINFTVQSQDPVLGGWQYTPRSGSDTSGLGWQLMALKSGHMGYLAVPKQTIENATKFLNSVQADGGATYGYATPGAGQATTAIGLLCRMYLGWKKDNEALQKGVEVLSNWGPIISDGNASMYYNYYATQVMHHWEGELWTKWNEKMRDGLVNSQSKQGHSTGSWYFNGDHGSELGGRLYNTALATMTLEVYYRHLPLYRQSSTEDEFEE